jgi:adenine phosphoribosyltransferase
MADPDVELILSKVVMYRDHPIPVIYRPSRKISSAQFSLQGHRFADIFPIFRNPKATEALISNFVTHIKANHDLSTIHSIVCLEARGFFFAPLIAARLGLACVPVRKKGKLPGKTISVSYNKDYESDTFEMKRDAFPGASEGKRKVLLVDDLVAKGRSA